MAAKRRKRLKRLKRRSHERSPAAVSSRHLLPTCEGPKLGRFEHGNAAVQFVNWLDAGKSGGDGRVFDVIIQSKHYALKMASDAHLLKLPFNLHKLIFYSWTDSFTISIPQLKQRA